MPKRTPASSTRSSSESATSGLERGARNASGTPACAMRSGWFVQLSGRKRRKAIGSGTSFRASVSETRTWQTVCSSSGRWLVPRIRRARVAPDGPAPSLKHRGRAMQEESEVYVGLDTSKLKISVAVAEAGRDGDVRFLGGIDSTPEAVERLVRKLAKRHRREGFVYEAGPTGDGLHRQIAGLGHDCAVVAPSLIPKRPGERVKTNRRDALTLAKLHRAGELTPVSVPDPAHEAIRELVRAGETAMEDL